MKNLHNLCFTIMFIGGCCCSALAEEKPEAPGIQDPRSSFRLAPIFQNNAVLQRDQPVAVWGRSIPGDRITVEFAGQNKSAVADAEGRWILHLDPMPVEKALQSLTAKSEQSGTLVQISNVIVGDVWFCSGQSNMLWALSKSTTGAAEMAQADYPLIRGFTFRANVAKEPSFDIPAGQWIVAQSKTETALDSPIRNFSGVAYHFAKKMFEETGIPIGFIQSAHGGTIIEGWLGEEALSSSPHIKKIHERWEELLESLPAQVEAYEKSIAEWDAKIAAGEKPEGRRASDPRGMFTERHRPSSLYNGMIAPFIPYGITGFLWYQGESNADRSDEYADLFPRLLRQFRTDFGDHPFYFVQLANYDKVRKDVSGRQWAFLREAQSRLLDQPNTGMAVTIDVGAADDVHPRNKAEVGRRLALQVLRNQHAHKIEAEGPRFKIATPENGAMRVFFHDSPELDLRSPDAPKSFEVAGADGVFQPARATVEGATLLVASEKVPQPRFVRYAWFNNPTAVLFSKEGLPAAPFQSNKQTQ